MTDVTTAQDYRKLSVGRVFGRSFTALRANPVPTLALGFVGMALPQILLQQLLLGSGLATGDRTLLYGTVGVAGLLIAVLWLVASGGIVQAVIAHDRNVPATIGQMVQVGLRRCLPLLAVYLLYLIGVWIGAIFLIVPGVMLGIMWAVAMPAVVAEHTGVIGAFGRSRALTKGARWEVFGILLLAFVLYMLGSVLVGIASVAGSVGSGSFAAMFDETTTTTSPSLLTALFEAVVSALLIVWITSLGASLFVELRHWKDGPTADRLGDIFA